MIAFQLNDAKSFAQFFIQHSNVDIYPHSKKSNYKLGSIKYTQYIFQNFRQFDTFFLNGHNYCRNTWQLFQNLKKQYFVDDEK